MGNFDSGNFNLDLLAEESKLDKLELKRKNLELEANELLTALNDRVSKLKNVEEMEKREALRLLESGLKNLVSDSLLVKYATKESHLRRIEDEEIRAVLIEQFRVKIKSLIEDATKKPYPETSDPLTRAQAVEDLLLFLEEGKFDSIYNTKLIVFIGDEKSVAIVQQMLNEVKFTKQKLKEIEYEAKEELRDIYS